LGDNIVLGKSKGKTTHDIPEDKIRCFVTDNLRDDTEHNRNRNKLAKKLYEEYGYSVEQMGIETTIKAGSKRYPVDLVVFGGGAIVQKRRITCGLLPKSNRRKRPQTTEITV